MDEDRQQGVEVGLLGPLVVTTSAGPVPVRGRQQGAVLAILAAALGREVPSEALVEYVWAGRPPATAGAALRVHVAIVRRLLGEAGVALRHSGTGYVLDPALVTTDVARFDALTAAAVTDVPPR